MKITCPNCSARYEVELPGLAGREVRVKCVKCQQKFLLGGAGHSPHNDAPSPVAAVTAGAGPGTGKSPSASQAQEPARAAARIEPSLDQEALAPEKQFDEEGDAETGDFGLAAQVEPVEEHLDGGSVAGETEDMDPLAALMASEQKYDDFSTGIDPIDFDEELTSQRPDATETEEPPGKKDDLDDLLNQILDGKLKAADTAAGKTTAGTPSSVDSGKEAASLEAASLKDPESHSSVAKSSPAGDETGRASPAQPAEVLPFLEETEHEGKSEVDRWAEAFAEEGLAPSMDEDLRPLDFSLGESAGNNETPAGEESAALPDEREGAHLQEIAEEVELFSKKEAKKTARENGKEQEESGKRPPIILARKKKSLFSLPASRAGKAVFYGGLLALALGAGTLYMLRETLLPGELLSFQKITAPLTGAPETRQIKSPEQPILPASEPPVSVAALPPVAETKPTLAGVENATQSGDKQDPAVGEAPVSGVAEGNKEPAVSEEPVPDVVKELSTLKAKGGAKEVEQVAEPSPGLEAALTPRKNSVTLSTIIPVAYSANEIKILSFNLVMELTDAESAEAVRGALPVFENATVATVDSLLENKFYNDILYVKEKLRTDLKTAYNDIIVGGRVKRVHFEDYVVQ